MFEKFKAKRVVEHTLYDVEKFINGLPEYEVYLAGGIDTALVASLFIAFCDFYAYSINQSTFGNLVVENFLGRVQFIDLYRGLIIDTHKDYYNIIKENLTQNNTPEGLSNGYIAISQYIGKKLMIDSGKTSIHSVIQGMLLTRMDDIHKATK